MNINKQYDGGQLKTVVKTILSFLGIYEDWSLESVDVRKLVIFYLLLQPGCLDYNHLYICITLCI